MKVRRDIASIPHRSAAATWVKYSELVTGASSNDVAQLNAAASVMSSLITDEAFRERPLTLAGVGDRLVVYLSYGQGAIEADEQTDKLAWNPTAGDWRLYVPCPEEQYDWAKRILATRAPRFVVLRPEEEVRDGADEAAARKMTVEVDWEAVGR